MNQSRKLLRHHTGGEKSLTVSGLDQVLDVRSRIAEIERQLSRTERTQLERADRELF
jgi:hypothetical protein